MTGADRARRAARAVVTALPPAIRGPARSLARRARGTDARRVAAGVAHRAGRLGRAVPGGARVLGPRWTVTATSWSGVQLTGPDGHSAQRSVLPTDTAAAEQVDGALSVRVPDPATLVRLVAAGLLSGSVRSVRLRVDRAPRWLWEGAAGSFPDPGTTRPTGLSWRSAGDGIDVSASWDRPAGVTSALETVLRALLRTRPWPQAGGPLPVLDRAGWLDGSVTPGHAVPLDQRPVARSDGPGPLRPFGDPQPWTGPHPVWSPVGPVAFPHRRRLVGEPARYRLHAEPAPGTGGSGANAGPGVGPSAGPGAGRLTVRDATGQPVAVLDGTTSPEMGIASSVAVRYATLQLGEDLVDLADGPWLRLVIGALATGGTVPVADGPRAADLLSELGIPSPRAVEEVTGPDGYAWSAVVSRTAGVLGDATLRRTVLASAVRRADRTAAPPPSAAGALLPLPQVSVLVASMRPDTVGALLADLAVQTYPAFEVVLGTHGWAATTEQLTDWSGLLGHPLRAVARATEVPFGEVLAALTRTADGDVLTKADDDDVYGPDHLTDLVLAWRQTGADLVAKAPRFVHLEDPAATPPTGAGADPAGLGVGAGVGLGLGVGVGVGVGVGKDPRGGTSGTTVDRSWAATEVFDRTPAGGTLLTARSTLLDAGGWSGSVRHVDIDLTARIRQAGGVTYRTHGLGYVYVRHARGHTWTVDHSVFLEQAGDVLPGLPAAIATGRPAGYRP